MPVWQNIHNRRREEPCLRRKKTLFSPYLLNKTTLVDITTIKPYYLIKKAAKNEVIR